MTIGDLKHIIETQNLPDDMVIEIKVADGMNVKGETAKTANYEKKAPMNFTHNITPFNIFQLNCTLVDKEDKYPKITFRKKHQVVQ
jgi:hypothetical protein